MGNMKKILLSTALVCLLTSTSSHAIDCKDPKAFVASVSDDVIKTLETKDSDSVKTTKLNKMFDQIVDSNWMSRFVLGRHWRTINPKQQQEYSKAYHDFLQNTYVVKFKEYTGKEKIQINEMKALENNNFIVYSEIVTPDKEPVNLAYRVQKTGACYKVNDIVAEGVSLINTQRQDFNSVVNRKGFPALLDLLKEKSDIAAN